MASQDDSGNLRPEIEHNPYSSASRWRHQESSAYHRHAAAQARDPVNSGSTEPLADFLNSSRVEPSGDGTGSGQHQPITVAATDGAGEQAPAEAHTGREVACGPLLNYRRMDEGRW